MDDRALQLSPYDPGTDQAVQAALRGLLGLPAHVPLQWRNLAPREQKSLRLEVVVGDEATAIRLRMTQTEAPVRAWWQGRHLAIDATGPSASRTLLDALQRRLQVLDKADDPHYEALIDAWRNHHVWAAIPQGEYATLGPRELLIRLTFRCDQDCSFCWQDRAWPGPPVAQLQRWMDEAHAQGVRQVIFSGGEPTLSPDLPALLAYARARGLVAALQTNAVQLAKPHVRDRVLAAGVDFAIVSYHSADAELSDAMTRAPGTHRRTHAGIQALLQAGVQVSLNVLVERRNLATLTATAAQIVGEFVPLLHPGRVLSVALLHPNAYLDRDQWRQTMAALDEVEPALTRTIKTLLDAGVLVSATGPCGYPLCALRHVPQVIPAVGKDWIAQANLTARVEAAACQSCALRAVCVGPRKTYLTAFGERGLVPYAQVPADLGAAAAAFAPV